MTAWTAWKRTRAPFKTSTLRIYSMQPFPKECDILLLQTVFAVANASKPTLSLTEMWIAFVSTRLIVSAVPQ